MRRRGRRAAIVLGAAVLAVGGILAVERERVAGLIHALRTGYWFEWMPEGVVPGYHGGDVLNDAGDVAVDVVDQLPFHRRAGMWSPARAEPRLLGVLETLISNPCAINRHAWIVGTISERQADGSVAMHRQAFLWTPAIGLAELPYLPEVPPSFISPRDINERGEVVGCTYGTAGRIRGFHWDIRSGIRDLGALTEDGESYAVAINDHGWILGNARDPAEVVGPVLWKPGSGIRALGGFPGAANSFAQDINNRGDVLVVVEMAESTAGAKITRPVLWTAERGYEEMPLPPGPGREWLGGSMNDSGEVLLVAMDCAYFLVSGGEVKELPRARRGVRTRYSALNNHGWLAGWVELEEEPRVPSSVRGFLAKPR